MVTTFLTVHPLKLAAEITYFDILLRGKGSVQVIFVCQWRSSMYLQRNVV